MGTRGYVVRRPLACDGAITIVHVSTDAERWNSWHLSERKAVQSGDLAILSCSD